MHTLEMDKTPTPPTVWEEPLIDVLRTRSECTPVKRPLNIACHCGRTVVGAPGKGGRGIIPVSHVAGGTQAPLKPCMFWYDQFGLYSKLDQALNMEQMLRDVVNW